MALSVKHAFQSAKSDGLDTTKVRASNWNAEHTLTASVDRILGTTSASTSVSEITCTAAGRALLDDADAAAQKATLGVAEVPIGAGFEWYSNSLPAASGSVVWGWANGQAISRSTYASLFSILSTTYGTGDGSTTFNVPDKREVVAIGRSGMGGTGARGLVTNWTISSLGAVVGEAAHTLSAAEMPAHVHNLGNHSHTFSGTTATESNNHTHSGTTATESNDHTHSGSTGTESITHAHSYFQSNNNNQTGVQSGGGLSVNSGGTTTSTGTEDTLHTHSFSTGGASAAHNHSFTTGAENSAHNHTFSGTTSGPSTDSGSAGSGGSHNNVQPSFVCNYVIRLA